MKATTTPIFDAELLDGGFGFVSGGLGVGGGF